MAISENVTNRRDYLEQWLKSELKGIPVTVSAEDDRVLVLFQEMLVCGIQVEEEFYRIYNASEEWKGETSYQCEQDQDGSWHYNLESADECIAECKRLVLFEAKKSSKKTTGSTEYSSAPLESDFWLERFFDILGDIVKQNMSGRKSEHGKEHVRFECYGTGPENRMRVYLHNTTSKNPEIISIWIGYHVVPQKNISSMIGEIDYRKIECKVTFKIYPEDRKKHIEDAIDFIQDIMRKAEQYRNN